MTMLHQILRTAAVVIGMTALIAQTGVRGQGQTLAIRNVTVIDGTGAAAQPGMTVVVTGNRITSVARNTAVPPQARVIDGTGKFLIPGLWEMHVHPRAEGHVPRFKTFGEVLLVANGVTGIRIMAGLPEFHRMKRATEAGEALGPRIFISSRVIDGLIPTQPLPPPFGDTAAEAEEWRSVGLGEIPRAFQVTNAAKAKEAIAISKRSGVEFVKIHNELTPEAYFALAKEAKAAGLYLTGHAPTGVSVAMLCDTGMRSIEHFPGMLEGCSTREEELLQASLAAVSLPAPERNRRNAELRRMAVDSFSAGKCAALAARLVKNDTWLSPTFMPSGGIKASAARNADLAKYVPAGLRARWQQQAAAAPEPAPPSREAQDLEARVDARRKEIVGIMKRGGVQFVVGTDQAIAQGALDTGSHQLSELIGRPTTTLAEYVRRVV